MQTTAAQSLTLGDRRGRLVLAAAVLGSSLAFVDATVVNIALPSIGRDLGGGTSGLTWVVNAYTLTLASLILLAGSLSDQRGQRRVFALGVAWFAAASLLCAVAPTLEALVGARLLQGVGGALLTPGSLAILHTSFAEHDRARVIGWWSGLTGVAGAIGPLLGGWLVDTGSWRWIFLVNLPVALVVLALTARVVPETPRQPGRFDVLGAGLIAVALGGLTLALVAAADAADSMAWTALLGGAAALLAFVLWERRSPHPLLPLEVFGSAQFRSVNLVTLLVYAALGGTFLWLVVGLQVVSGFDPLTAGMALLPVTVLMLLFSGRAGALSARTGPRLPMTLGALTAAVGVLGLSRLGPGASYVPDVLVPVLFLGTGLTVAVTPLTAAALDSLPDDLSGMASGVNNAVARTGSLLSVAALPLLTGLGPEGFAGPGMGPDFQRAMWWCAGFLVCGSLLSYLFVGGRPRLSVPVEEEPVTVPAPSRPAAYSCGVCGPPPAAEPAGRR